MTPDLGRYTNIVNYLEIIREALRWHALALITVERQNMQITTQLLLFDRFTKAPNFPYISSKEISVYILYFQFSFR